MKHRALSMLLALVMVVSLLPIAAIAGDMEENTGTKEPIKEEDTVEGKPDDGPQVLFEDDNTTYYLGIADENGLFGPDGGCDLSSDTDSCGFALVVQVFTLVGEDYEPVSDEVRSDLNAKYDFDLQIRATESCVDHYYPELGDDGVYRFTTASLGDWIFVASATKKGGNQSITYKARLTIALKRTQAKGILGMSNGGDFVKELEFFEGEHDVMLAVGTDRLRSDDVISANNKPADGKLTYGGVVKAIEYAGGPWWKITLEDSEEADSKGWIQYGEDENNRVNITVRPAPQPFGQLEVDYNSGFTRNLTLVAGTYDVELRLIGENENEWWLDAKYKNQLSVDGVVSSIATHEFTDNEGYRHFFWRIVLAEPTGKQATGHIEYTDGEGHTSSVTITCVRSYGDEVTGAVIKQGTDDYAEISDNLVTSFPWDGKTYYLGTAEYQNNLGDIGPFGQDERGVIREDGTYQDMFFAPRVFEYIEDDYKLREDIRKEIENAGYIFKLDLLPTDHGCEYYPVTIPVELDSIDPNTEKPVTETWEQHLVTEKSVGSWIYKVSIVKRDDATDILAENMSMASYLANVYTYIPVTGEDDEAIIGTIKASIEGHWDNLNEDLKELVDTGLCDDFIVLQLPSGEINGQIEIPDTQSIVMLRGAGFENDLISTTIRGGVKLGDVSCNVEGIHFIGDGTTNEYLADRVTRNSAIYGEGQGVYNGCIFENYYCAIHSSEDCAPAWGGWSSVFYKNGTALHLNTELGGNLEMVDNWFVGNGTAIWMEDALEEIYFLQSRQNRFVNNDYDLVNDSGKTMWMSQNFFYHDYDAVDGKPAWEPVLWEEVTTENGNGLQLKHAGKNGAILAENMPEFVNTQNYNTLSAKGDPQYLNFLPWFDGDDKTLAYPLARTQECNTFFYPNWKSNVYSSSDPYYPSYVQQGVTISEDELDGLRFSSYDSASDTAVGTFEFSASAAEAEN